MLRKNGYDMNTSFTHPPFPLKPFYFIRHGETDWNKLEIVMGSTDIPLNELGIKQAHEASVLLENENFDIIVSSPKARAQQTADIISQKTSKDLIFEENLAERTWGDAEGKPHDPTKFLLDDTYVPQGAETFSAFQNRVIQAISGILRAQNLPLIVSHGGVFQALTLHLGYQDLTASNCTPFFFKPPPELSLPWLVCSLDQ
jgi:broad specificity phosphatase PhoE